MHKEYVEYKVLYLVFIHLTIPRAIKHDGTIYAKLINKFKSQAIKM